MRKEKDRAILREQTFSEIDRVLSDLPTEEEIIKHDEGLKRNINIALPGLTTMDYPTKWYPGAIVIDNFDLLFEVLTQKLEFTEDEATSSVQHEKAHFEAAERLGLAPMICLNLCQAPDEQTAITPCVIFRISDRMDPEELKRKLKLVTSAPDELSPDDLESLKLLKG